MAPSSGVSNTSEDLSSWLASAAALRQRGAFEELLHCCIQANQQHPDSIEILLHWSWALDHLQGPAKALTVVNQALNVDPSSEEARKRKSALLEALSTGKNGEDLAGRINNEILDHSWNRIHYAKLAEQFQQLSRAQQALEEAILNAPEKDQVFLALLGLGLQQDDPTWTWLEAAPLNSEQPSPTLPCCQAFLKSLYLNKNKNTNSAFRSYQEAIEQNKRLITEAIEFAAELISKSQASLAIGILRKLQTIHPENTSVALNLSYAYSQIGEIHEAIEQILVTIQSVPASLSTPYQAALLSFYNYMPGITPATIKERAQSLGKLIDAVANQSEQDNPPRRFPPRPPSAPLRVGLIGGDFHLHPVGLMLHSVLEVIDSKRISPLIYANVATKMDWLNRKFKLIAQEKQGGHINIKDLNDEELVRQIRDDNIDILIDLAGYTQHTRISVFARRPAPVQISWLGYFSTTGLRTMDFVILDPWHAGPRAEDEYTETILQLKPNRFCFTPMPGTPPVGQQPILRHGHVTFASFNRGIKLNRDLLTIWRRILTEVPNSRLILKLDTTSDPGFRFKIFSFFAEAGIQSHRIDLRPRTRHLQMLAQYADVDIVLDPFPFSGGYTSLEALWMGVPIITLPGDRVVSRQTLSFLACVDALELVARDQDHYVALAVALATDPERLQRYRRELRPRMAASPLCQPERFAEQFTTLLEQTYATIRAESEPL